MNKVDSNRVTIVIGATGCGKSTQLPQMLCMHLRKRVLCVQPRCMAVVAVATRVSQELGEPLGEGTVGYHIGAAKVAELDNTQLMFVTAGIFLQTLKSDGAAALEQYGAVIVDEVHERSCENDLALACLMQLAIHAKELRALRIVLMSATADVRRYREFVRQLCDDHAGKPGEYAIGESAKVYNTTSRYLRDALTEAESSLPLESFEKQDYATLHQICVLLSSLVPALVRRTIREDGPGCTILVFLATYASIEQTYARLDDLRFAGIPIYVLHSCMDMDDCMAALLGEDGAPARVVLASSVAESSITIKRVTHVVDSCRSCEIHWTPMTGQSSAHIVWASQAQMQQRAGRTGRTNNGTVSDYFATDAPSLARVFLRLDFFRQCSSDARPLLAPAYPET